METNLQPSVDHILFEIAFTFSKEIIIKLPSLFAYNCLVSQNTHLEEPRAALGNSPACNFLLMLTALSPHASNSCSNII